MKRALFCATSVALASFVPALRSQVVISEIEFTSRNNEGQWIELVNLGQQEVDVGSWSLYLATLTPNMPQNYWWGFPRGTKIGPGKFLRVHWLRKVRANPPAGNIDTGDTVLHFLFGLFAEKLDLNRGALALVRTQANNLVNDGKLIQDWVSWGTSGFKREDLAVRNNRWKNGSFAPIATGSPSPTLAYDYTNPLGVHEGSFWFRDFTPTPGADNLGGAAVTVYGTSCRGTLNAVAQQVANGKPINGNRDFRLAIDRPLATEEFALALLGLRGNGKLVLFGCPYWLDPTTTAIVLFIPKSGTRARLSFTGLETLLAGLQFSSIWAVADIASGRLGFTNGVQLKFGK